MDNLTVHQWILKEAFKKGFTKDDLFIGEISLHNVLCNQIPSAMLKKGCSQQSVRKELLRMIDEDGLVADLQRESEERRVRRAIHGPPLVVESQAALESYPDVEEWVRKASLKVAFSKDGLYIGEIRLHNILINSITSTLATQGFTPLKVRKALLKLISEGLSKELQEESRYRRGISVNFSGVTSESESNPGPQPVPRAWYMANEEKDIEFPPLGKKVISQNLPSPSTAPPPPIYSPPPQSPPPLPAQTPTGPIFPPLQWGPRSLEHRIFEAIPPNPQHESKPKKAKESLVETTGAKRLKALKFPFCVQHAILTNLQDNLEAAFFDYSQIHCPALLTRNDWGCSHAGEINSWTKELIASYQSGELSGAIVKDPDNFAAVLKGIGDLRDITLYRTPISEERLIGLVGSALDVMVLLEDDTRAEKITKIAEVISDCTKECIDTLDILNSELDKELEKLDAERRKLEIRELQIREDAENAMKKVENSVERKFVDGLKTLDLHSHYVGSS